MDLEQQPLLEQQRQRVQETIDERIAPLAWLPKLLMEYKFMLHGEKLNRFLEPLETKEVDGVTLYKLPPPWSEF